MSPRPPSEPTPPKPPVTVQRLSKALPNEAVEWLRGLGEVCTLSRPGEFASVQSQTHGWFDFTLLLRDQPTVVLAAGDDLSKWIENLPRTELSWLLKDAFVVLATDETGVRHAENYGLNIVPWSEQGSQMIIQERASLYQRTSLMKGFSHALYQIRRRILVYSEQPQERSTRPHVLVLGESRAGKELVALALYESSALPKERFAAIPCGMLSENLLVDQLFGHWKGAFDGATSDARGYLARCSGGAVFLDDLDAAENPLTLQGLLLRFLSTDPPEVVRLGIPKQGRESPERVATWLICATNKSPREMERAGTMRDDFLNRFYHLIKVPGFRHRREDIPFIARALVAKTASRPLDINALKWLRDRESDWLRNASELQALLVCAGDLIRFDTTLTWRQAFDKVAARGSDPLAWYEVLDGSAPERLPPPEQSERQLVESAKSRLNSKGSALLEDLQERLDSRTDKSPERVHYFRCLSYLVDNAEDEKNRRNLAAALDLSVSWVTKIVEGLFDFRLLSENGSERFAGGRPSGLVESKRVGPHKRFVYRIRANLLKDPPVTESGKE